MSTFFFQSALLIAVAYFLGAVLGCWLRKLFKNSASMLHTESAVGAGAVVAGAVAATQYAGVEREASIEINRPQPEPVHEVYIEELPPVTEPAPVIVPETITYVEPEPVLAPEPISPSIPTVIFEPEPEVRIIEQNVVVEPVVREQVVINEVITPVVPEVVVAPVVPTPVVEARVVTTPAVEAPVVTTPVFEAPVVPTPVIEEIVDDLTRIKGVGLPVALELKKIGIMRFEQVARWTDADVAHISKQLGFSGRVERENWMDQARILASGDELEFTTHQLENAERDAHAHGEILRRGRSERADRQWDDRNQPVRTSHSFTRVSQTDGPAYHQPQTSIDDLKLIIGIDTTMAEKLNQMGIVRLEQIANWNASEIDAFERQLETQGRIKREKWVEQAGHLIG